MGTLRIEVTRQMHRPVNPRSERVAARRFLQLRIYVHELPPWMNLLLWGEQLTEHTDRLTGGYGRAHQ